MDSGILARRSRRWLQVRIRGLLVKDTRLTHYFQPKEEVTPSQP